MGIWLMEGDNDGKLSLIPRRVERRKTGTARPVAIR